MNAILLLGMPGGQEWLIVLAALLIPVICIIDIARSEFSHPLLKPVWCAMVVFIPLIGAVFYYWVGTEQKVTSKG